MNEEERREVYSLARHLWEKAWLEYRLTGRKPENIMDLAIELSEIAVQGEDTVEDLLWQCARDKEAWYKG